MGCGRRVRGTESKAPSCDLVGAVVKVAAREEFSKHNLRDILPQLRMHHHRDTWTNGRIRATVKVNIWVKSMVSKRGQVRARVEDGLKLIVRTQISVMLRVEGKGQGGGKGKRARLSRCECAPPLGRHLFSV